MKRRDFFRTTTVGGMLGALRTTSPAPAAASKAPNDRERWLAILSRVADPVLTHLASGTLKTSMPVEEADGAGRRPVTHLEAFGRLVAGIAPWIELSTDATAEGKRRAEYADKVRAALASAVDPASPDFMNFTSGGQPLVDAAFLGHGVLRAPRALGAALSAATRGQLVAALEATRSIQPGFNNWLLFSATVEAALAKLGAPWDKLRVDYALRQHAQWYKGDGVYGDGPDFHAGSSGPSVSRTSMSIGWMTRLL